MRRGVGYCENNDCEDFSKGVFLLNHGNTFYCPHCRQLGYVEPERGSTENEQQIFREVHVHYNFEPLEKAYREIGIVRDDGLDVNRTNVYHLYSPLIKTENRALKVAEAVLGNLNRYRGLLDGDEVPKTTEIILSFDDELSVFAGKLDKLAREWEASPLAGGAS
jgi:ribosomal protein S27AE